MAYLEKSIIGTVSLSDATETVTLDIPRSSWYQKIYLYTKGSFTTGSSVNADAMKDFYSTVDLVANGTSHYTTASSRAIYELNTRDYGTRLDASTVGASASGATYTAEHVLDYRFNFKDPFDISASIPANRLSSLQLKLTHSDMATLIGSGSSATGLQVTVVGERWVFDNSAEEAKMLKNVRTHALAEQNTAIGSTTQAYGTNMIDLPTGRLIKNVLMATSVSGSYSDDLVDRMKIKQTSPVAKDIYENCWTCAKKNDQIDNSIESGNLATGWANIDATYISGYLNTVNLKQGDIKLDMINSTNTGSVKTVVRSYL